LVDLSTAEVATETPRRVEVKLAADFVPTQKIDPNACKFADFAKRCQPGNWKMEQNASIFSSQAEHQSGAEKFRTLRSRLYQIATAQPLKKIVVTSSTPAEGRPLSLQIWHKPLLVRLIAECCSLIPTYGRLAYICIWAPVRSPAYQITCAAIVTNSG